MAFGRASRREVLKAVAALGGMMVAPSLWGADSGGAAGGFKIGAVDWELTKACDPGALAVAARLGFDGVQVDLGNVEGMRSPERQKQYLETAKQQKVEIASLALGVLNEVPYAQSPKAQGLVDTAIDIAAAMKQRVILLAFFGKGDLGNRENREDALVGRLKENAVKAEKAGVVLGIEAEISVARYRKILDAVGSPAVQAYFDLVHAHIGGGDMYEEIVSLKGRICEFHAKDYGNILFGKGKVDFAEVRRAMDAIGYRGWIQVEQWAEINGPKPLGFEQTQRTNLKYLRDRFPAA